ncbi:MAG: phosphatidate cytidylyltransferase [Deltaproteobacteria bacterium]|nr:phosphatidate cytidylyltransferase [Deltaproteobacteria bacterium]
MHLKRWLTGIIAIPILILLIGAGTRWPFYSLLYIVSLAGLIEFYGMGKSRLPGFVRVAGYLLAFLLFLTFSTRQLLLVPAIIALCAILPMSYYMLVHPSPDPQRTADMGRALIGPVYIALPLAMLIMIDMRPNGNIWIFFFLAVIFANDTGAFYFGRLFGRHKLYEAVSPNKTWEGAFGGLLSSMIVAVIFLRVLAVRTLGIDVFVFVFVLSTAAQIGDLAESMLKRNHGVKDSGKLLPGHGGVLDRIDGILFAIPVLYFFLSW